MWLEKVESLLEGMFHPVKIDKGSLLFSEGSLCPAVPFVKEGELKVYLISDSGRELTLYRVKPGQMCMLAMITVYSGNEYPAYTRAEENSLIFMVPGDLALRWFEENHLWRSLFMNVLSENLLSVTGMLNSMVSERVEERLINYLLSEAEGRSFIQKTHEEIARDVGSVRVVVSRVLKELERDGLIELCRGRLLIKDHEALKRRAGITRP
ncbi:MAG: Crp/Fnr family transcriptional regulator [Aquificaceae bacterium]|jgi:CRP/FNR family transcriptional regulator|uniref:Crp/Fnr family transcriptional regulator n=1 Tax=Hydrogenobacter sp. Uz 6-8 TaxID=3384828 RepID=UPI000F2198C5|nr:MAG: Crp/Fnr family transcriptional regulator [Aquificota bacterium]